MKEGEEKEEEMRTEILALHALSTSAADEFCSPGIRLVRAGKLITSLGNSKGNYD